MGDLATLDESIVFDKSIHIVSVLLVKTTVSASDDSAILSSNGFKLVYRHECCLKRLAGYEIKLK